jgi:protein O-GlcNAc transferase
MTALDIHNALEIAIQQHRAGRLQQAEVLYQQILQRHPDHADALHLLGVLEWQQNRHDVAIDLIRRAINLNPSAATYQLNLGKLMQSIGRHTEAITALEQALALGVPDPAVYVMLGNAYEDSGQLDRAVGAFQRAVELKPDYAEGHNNLGGALFQSGRLDEAIGSFQKTLALRPDYFEALSNLGNALSLKGELDRAVECHRAAVALRPEIAQIHCNLGNALKDQGLLDEAIACFNRAVALQPDNHTIHSNRLCAIMYHPGYDAEALYEEHVGWGQRTEPLQKLIGPHTNDRNPDCPLRIGYVSADFRDHASAFFLWPLLRCHDHEQFQIYCYAEVSNPDSITQRLQACADQWRSTVGRSDDQVAQQIRDDRIDILVDLKGHMANNRALVFARKPAPLQVSWMGYVGTTGLPTMDYRLTDSHLHPPGMDQYCSETSICLPDCVWCYDPLTTEPAVNALPAVANGYVTFGCLGNFCKINNGVLQVWAQVLNAVPRSRLLILADTGSHRGRLLDELGGLGVDPARIEFTGRLPRPKYLELYQRLDIVLDTFPYNGHTTSLDALWMGVPIVTLAGQTAVARMGLSLNANLGMTELVAETPEQYVEIATALAADLPRLNGIRSTLRQRMVESPLMDASRFARNIEAAYRGMWRWWCETVSEKHHG